MKCLTYDPKKMILVEDLMKGVEFAKKRADERPTKERLAVYETLGIILGHLDILSEEKED